MKEINRIIDLANKKLKKKFKWVKNQRLINAIQIELAENADEGGEGHIELESYTTISGRPEIIYFYINDKE